MRIYIDSNVYLDFFLDRNDAIIPWSDLAFKIFCRTYNCEFEVVLSDVLLKELSSVMKIKEEFVWSEIKEITNGKIIEVKASEKQIGKAIKISKEQNVPVADVLHSLIAISNKAAVVTKDKHFEKLRNVLNLEVYNPKEI